MKLFETSLPENYSKGLYEDKCYDLAPEHMDKILDIAFVSIADALNAAKRSTNKERPVSFEFNAITDDLVVAFVLQYFANEDPSKPGNYNLVCTFDEADIPEGANRLSIKDPVTHSYFRAYAGNKWGIKFKDPAAIVTLITYAFEMIKKWLDENAKEGEEVTVEQEGVFQARVAIENGEKVFALEPAGEIKMLIKNDIAIEK